MKALLDELGHQSSILGGDMLAFVLAKSGDQAGVQGSDRNLDTIAARSKG